MAEEQADSFRRIETRSDSRDAAIELAKIARRTLAIFTQDMEPGVLDDPEFVDLVKELALGSRFARVNILCVDITRAIKEGNRLLDLSRRLTSFVEIREPHKDFKGMQEAFIIADETGLLHRKLGGRWDGFVNTSDPMLAREKLKLFNDIWQRSDQHSDTRRLGI
ncbi:MAG: hypothetical protein R3270_07955 [Gammaproteobacteria bacterium]|nr:hypothetical protein [Gammaproteobacteria bacterium]